VLISPTPAALGPALFAPVAVAAEPWRFTHLQEAAAASRDGLLVATYNPMVNPWVRAVFHPSGRGTVPVDTQTISRLGAYTPMPFEDRDQGLYQRYKNDVSSFSEDMDHLFPLHNKGVLLVDAQGWALFFDAAPELWQPGFEVELANSSLFVLGCLPSGHVQMAMAAQVAERMARIQPLLDQIIGPKRAQATPCFAPDFTRILPTP
jgi:hypothetical protein